MFDRHLIKMPTACTNNLKLYNEKKWRANHFSPFFCIFLYFSLIIQKSVLYRVAYDVDPKHVRHASNSYRGTCGDHNEIALFDKSLF